MKNATGNALGIDLESIAKIAIGPNKFVAIEPPIENTLVLSACSADTTMKKVLCYCLEIDADGSKPASVVFANINGKRIKITGT